MKNRVITFAALFVFASALTAQGLCLETASDQALGARSGPALEQLTGISGAAAVPPSAAEVGETAVLPVPVKAIPPGSDLLPQFSDPGRVKVILKVIEDVYYERPFPYPQDGTVFHNREKLLPRKPDGYYREYTVIPPKDSPSCITIGGQEYCIRNRGAERLVIGGGETAYYTPDHYKTFIQLTVIR